MENTTPFRLRVISCEELGREPKHVSLNSQQLREDYLSPGREKGATYHRIYYTLYSKMRKIESDKNLGIKTGTK